ncbi:poly-gamma-glutamate synthesis protein (capsule biosynthesis protein) [Sediminihabitans luteus]|uniref:Poly-gamma-glutamate synthesis protein (Capsule biosynthesis protein) n=1 Tax=Sediminihabitans luteus TaxID=1138585 RepID=A0A2M9CCI4_9CELL|nr:CapA family protein [Sediminihabitans luteus]PJJ69033.1 poly-gamma-glutamate synthesis protein (capsule biosynthesis protein) [Sediminihabitans luteus]GII99419.1 hypothetical protein Slu03_17970 [Sediminihabitans luteus]
MTRHFRRRRRPRRLVAGTVVATFALVVGGALGTVLFDEPPASVQASGSPQVAVAATQEPSPTPTPQAATFTIVATGDVLPHTPVNASARTADGGYDFSDLLAGADPWVSGADLALCHMEVPVTPAGEQASGYPRFAALPQIVGDLAEQGWDGCSTASNHSVDRGFAGVEATLDTFDAAGLGHTGTARTAAEAALPQLYRLERAGRTLTVAHISAAYGTNGLPVPAEQPWSVNLIDTAAIVQQATAARAAGADLVVVSLHAGVEYTTTLTDQQVQVTHDLAASGAVDLVIGHHAHVPQAIERLDGGPDGAGLWVAYGLGNYVSNQDASCCSPATSNGILMTATVVQEPGAPAHVTGVEWSATTVDTADHHHVHVLEDVAGGVGTLSAATVADRLAAVRSVVGTDAPERTTPPTPTGPPPVVVPREETPVPTATAPSVPTSPDSASPDA